MARVAVAFIMARAGADLKTCDVDAVVRAAKGEGKKANNPFESFASKTTPIKQTIFTDARPKGETPKKKENEPCVPGKDAKGNHMLFPAIWCGNCGADSHVADNCLTKYANRHALKCFDCGHTGHMKWICPTLGSNK